MGGVLRYVDRTDPEASRRARARYSCFDHFGGSEHLYGRLLGAGMGESCEQAVMEELADLKRRAVSLERAGPHIADDFFYAEQNARVVKNAEAYYRMMYLADDSTWN